jgi:4-amino-4-deoxy-L-arabinose transferase-like glycosyltransferase
VKSRLSAASLLPLAFFVLALLPRLAGLTWGLPSAEHWYSYHPDERQIVQSVAALDFLNGDFNPNFFNYPSLYIYGVHLFYVVAGALGLNQTLTPGAPTWPIVHDIILYGRILTALFGAATAALVFLLGREIGDRKLGAVAALFMAFAPGHVQHSHFATVDVPSTFWIALALYLSARAVRDNAAQPKDFVWAAFAAGLAAATKYNAALVVIAPLFGIALTPSIARPKYFGTALLAVIIGFLIGCPFSVLSFSEFWGDDVANGFYYEFFVHSRQGHGEVFLQTGRFGWWYHLGFNLPFALTLPLLLLSVAGLILTTRDTARRKYFVPLLGFTLLYFFALGFSQVRFMRYTLPLIPALAIFTALAVERIAAKLATPTQSKYFAVAAVPAAIVLIGAFNVLWPFVTTDPRDAAVQWLRSRESAGATVGLVNPPWFWTPPLSPQDAPPGSGQTITQSLDGKWQFNVTGFDVEKLQSAQPKYFVVSELEWVEKERLGDASYLQWKQTLDNEYQLAQQWNAQSPLTLPGRSYVPHDFLYASPAVRVYVRKTST